MIEATLALLVVVCMVLSSVLGILAPDIVTETVTYKYYRLYNKCWGQVMSLTPSL